MNRKALFACLAVVALSSCGGGGGGSGGGSGGGGVSGGGGGGGHVPPYGLDQRTTVSGLTFPDSAVQSGDVLVQEAFPNLSFTDPLAPVTAPGDPQHMFVATHGGQVFVFDNSDSATSSRVFLDLTDVTKTYEEEGLVSLVFDPHYQDNGFFYVQYTANVGNPEPGDTVVARFHANPVTQIAERDSETVLLQFTQLAPYTNHKAGDLVFGPDDGMLYIVVGDGGGAGDPGNHSQNLGSYLGKILRIAPDGSIPSDNPFVATPGALPEIWSYGMRNPFRIAFDPVTKKLWAADVGQYNWEEIDIITRGGNYGWHAYEGNHVYDDSQGLPDNAIFPIYEYDHSQGCAIIGGSVYRGTKLTQFIGRYFYTDYCSGKLWALTQDDGAFVSNQQVGTIPGNPTSFGADADGELYVTSFDGHIYRLVPNPSAGGGEFPQKLSQTGLFLNLASMKPAPGLIPYDVNAPFWSDGARKSRWIALPGEQVIGFDPDNAWAMPQGTVLVKHFDIMLADGSSKRLETRVLINQTDGWHGYDYKWNDAGTDADLLSDGLTETLDVQDSGAPGGHRTQSYEYPSPAACLECHNDAAGRVLGLTTAQMNRSHDYGAVTDNQLRTLDHIGVFDLALGNPAQLPKQADPADASAPLSARAKSWLAANCAQCHRPGGFTNTNMDLRLQTPVDQMQIVGVPPQKGDLGVSGAKIVAPGSKENSVLWLRINRLDDGRMPPLGSHVIDQDAVDLIGQWIDAGAN